MLSRGRGRGDDGAVAVVVALVLAFVMMPLTALGTGAYVRSTSVSELQRSADSGSLAAAASVPLGDINFAVNFLDAATDGATTQTLQQLGLHYDHVDPLDIACQVAHDNATAPTAVSAAYADDPTCSASYLSDLDTLASLQSCASGLLSSGGGPVIGPLGDLVPGLAPLLPALLYPGVKVTMTWHVNGPLDKVFSVGDGPKTQ